MAADRGAGEGTWRAAALDVRGPGTRGRRDRWPVDDGVESFATGDRGELWIGDGALYFAGRLEAWSVPLGWLGAPVTGLSGTLEIPVRTADHARAIRLRLLRGDDERPLAEAIRLARLEQPDPRDRRALQDLLALVQPELERLDEAADAATSVSASAMEEYASQLLAASARMRATWLPYWGDPASRLREATTGALVAAGEASLPRADEAAQGRYDQAVRRWCNVCEDLHDWCGLPESPLTLPAPRRPEKSAVSSSAAPDRDRPEATPPAPVVAEEFPAMAPAPPSPAPEPLEEAGANQSSEPQPGSAPEDDADEAATVLAPMHGQYQGMPASGVAESTPQTPVVTGPGRRGSGGMTMIYRRSGPGPGGNVARKELQPEGMQMPDAKETFLRIGERFATVQHPNFVRILDADTSEESTPYIDMEFVEGEGISARLRRGPLPVHQALDVIDQLAGAIDAIHRAALIHGDLRPQNVLLEPGGRAVLLEPSVACDHILEQRRGTIYGELSYLTPERVHGETSEARGDIYALGSLAFALLTGRPPFEGQPAEIFAGHAEQTPPSLNSVMPGAPPAASAAIARALAKRPSERPQAAVELATALRRAFSERSQRPAPSPLSGPSPTFVAERPVHQQPPPGSSIDRQSTEQIERPSAAPMPAPEQPPGRSAPSPLGRSAPSPLGRATPPVAADSGPTDDDDDLDRTVIVRPPR